MATILGCLFMFVACSKIDDNGGLDHGDGQKMKIELTHTGDLSNFTEFLVLQVATADGRVINVEGEDWKKVTTEFMPVILFETSGEVKAKRTLSTTDIVRAITIASGFSSNSDTEGSIKTNVKIYSDNKLIKNYDHVATKDIPTQSFTIAATHNGEVIVGGE